MDRYKYLKNIYFLRNLNRNKLKKIVDASKIIKVNKRQLVFSESQRGKNLYVVLNGKIKIFITSPTGQRKTFTYLGKGDFFGEMALLDQKVRSASAIAVEDTELMTISSSTFKSLLVKYPKITIEILKTLSQRLRRTDKEIEELSFQNVLGRVCSRLLDFSMRYGEKTHLGTKIKMKLTIQELADLVATSREVVSRVVKSLQKTGLIKIFRRNFIITNREKLLKLCY